MAKNDQAEGRAPKLQGLECPRCGCRHMYVMYTRSTPTRIVRIRECRHCGRRLKTCEQATEYVATFGERRADSASLER